MSPEASEPTELSLAYEMRQPRAKSTVWQANQLAIARYQATEMQQKLILYAIAMIDAKSTGFARYRIHVAAYADACGLQPNNVYSRLKEAAEDLARNPLLIEGHVADDGKVVDLLTHWFAQVELGDGYIDITFPPGLKRYLVEVRENFFKFDLCIPLQFSGEHAIRLYQWAKRWKFVSREKSISLQELRFALGLVDLDKKGKITKERLTAYGDLKKWALNPALSEINRASDILLSMREIKVPGTKRVESLAFTIRDNPAYKPDETAPKLLPAVKVAAPVDPAVTAMRETLLSEFALSPEQARMVVGKYPLPFIEAKAAIVRARPCDNVAAVLLSALSKDYQPAKSNKPAKKEKAKKAAPAPEPVLTPEEEAARAEAGRIAFAAMKVNVKGGPRAARREPAVALVAVEPEGDELPF